jgi:DNA-binding response OmpR family regulator
MSSPPRRVLVVEDEPQVAVMLQDFLVDLGHDVLIAPNGADALRMFPRYHPNVVLLDMMLPEVSGDTVFQCFRLADPDIPVILVTGVEPEIARRTLARGAFDYLAKPFDLQALARTVGAAVASRG